MNNEKFGFTLAEILITLGIIGVVTAMTIPTLITNYRKIQTVNRLKKAYSMMSQAIRASQNSNEDNGGCLPFAKVSASGRLKEATNFVENCLAPHINISKICVPTSNDCWKDSMALNNVTEALARNSGTEVSSLSISFVLSNGDSVYMWVGPQSDSEPAHVRFFYDIDGMNSGKSILGKDIFVMLYHPEDNQNFILEGNGLSRDELLLDLENIRVCSKDSLSRSAGYYCGALIQKDGWTISKDYPW